MLTNLGLGNPVSGTVGGATYAADDAGIPAVAFSSELGSQMAWNVMPVLEYSIMYAQLAATVTNALLRSGTPYLPKDVYLNVNYPSAPSRTGCSELRTLSSFLAGSTALRSSLRRTYRRAGVAGCLANRRLLERTDAMLVFR